MIPLTAHFERRKVVTPAITPLAVSRSPRNRLRARDVDFRAAKDFTSESDAYSIRSRMSYVRCLGGGLVESRSEETF